MAKARWFWIKYEILLGATNCPRGLTSVTVKYEPGHTVGAYSKIPGVYGCYRQGADVNGHTAWYMEEYGRRISWDNDNNDWFIGNADCAQPGCINSDFKIATAPHHRNGCPTDIGYNWRYYDGEGLVEAFKGLTVVRGC